MVATCCVYGCKERAIKGASVTFHCFPKDEERRKIWEANIYRENFKATKTAKVCSKHFTLDCFDREKFGGTWLKNTAIPTLFDFPKHLIKKKITQKPFIRKTAEPEPTREQGAPATLEDTSNIDWAPSLRLGHDFFDGKRKLKKRKKDFTPNCQCHLYVHHSEYERNFKKSVKEEVINDDTSLVSRDVEKSEDSEVEGCMSSPESSASDTESISHFKDCPFITIKSENSTNNECITHDTVTSDDAGSRIVESKDVLSTYIIEDDIDFKTSESEIVSESDEALSAAVKSENIFSDGDDNLESVQGDTLHEIPDEFSQRILSKSISEPKNFNDSGQISCVTHTEAFSAAETLLRYMMNQDEVNDIDVNFILNLALKIKKRIN